MTLPPVEDPRLKVWAHAMVWLEPKENERAMQEGIALLAELKEKEIDDLLDANFGTFSRASGEQQKQAFLEKTHPNDIWRVLLTEHYLELLERGIETLPESPYWRVMLVAGGRKAFNRRRREFIRHWNREMRAAGREDQVYSGGRSERV